MRLGSQCDNYCSQAQSTFSDFRLHHTCSIIIIIMASLTKWCYLSCQLSRNTRESPAFRGPLTLSRKTYARSSNLPQSSRDQCSPYLPARDEKGEGGRGAALVRSS